MIPETITTEFIESRIEDVSYKSDKEKKTTGCSIKVEKGFKVIGIAYRQWSVEHNEEKAKEAAYQKAMDKLYSYYSFLSHAYHVGKLPLMMSKEFIKKNELRDKTKSYSLGDIFNKENDNYIIIGYCESIGLMCLRTGCLFAPIIRVQDPYKITENEWRQLTANQGHLFRKI